jgi:hypothetical protein
MRLRGSTKDESGRSVRVSRVMVCAGLVGCQGPVGRTGTEGERGGECGVGSGLGCVSRCSQCWFASMAWPQLLCCALTSLANARGKVW